MAISLDDNPTNPDDEYKSKTQVKQEMADLRKLGEDILQLPEPIYQTLALNDEIDEAIKTAKKISSFIAKKRQVQFIGKLLRKVDTTVIEQKINSYKQGRKNIAKQFQQVEAIRDKLLLGNTEQLTQFFSQYPQCDKQQIKQLIRNAQKEQKLAKPPTNKRKLFQVIQSTINNISLD